MMSTPYLKFISHISQFIIFLILIVASALRDNHVPTGLGKKILPESIFRQSLGLGINFFYILSTYFQRFCRLLSCMSSICLLFSEFHIIF